MTPRRPSKRLSLPVLLAVLAGVLFSTGSPDPAAAGIAPEDYSDTAVLSGLSLPIAVDFADDGRVFVAEKRGVIMVFDDLDDPTPEVFADLRTEVYNHWDRGLMGMVLHPDFPAQPYVYVAYAHDYDPAFPGDIPRWGTPDTDDDPCPTPPGANADGCVIQGRVSQLVASGNQMTAENVFIEDFCQQFPSHSLGDLEFGADGALYVSAGEGANFGTIDIGQLGSPANPCGDPSDEGGVLRSQDLLTTGDPLGLSGSILRLDPMTGAAAADNPAAGSADANEARIVAHGLRNPFRFGIRPGTDELFIGDVGWGTAEEINLLADAADAPVENFGWPCYEGSAVQVAYAALGTGICNSLYAAPGAETPPYLEYDHVNPVVPGENCPLGGSSPTGVAFYEGGDYPPSMAGAMFFADFSRRCIWAVQAGPDGRPDGSTVTTFITDAAPVDLAIGPDGDLFYVDILAGSVHRVAYTQGNNSPVAAVAAAPQTGDAPLAVTLDASGSTDPDAGDTLTYAWDLDGDGDFADAAGPVVATTYNEEGVVIPVVEVTDSFGATDTASTIISVGGSTVPGPAESPWTLNGSATMIGGDVLRLTEANDFETGTAFYPVAIDSGSITVSFDATIGGGTGGDGLTLAFIDGASASTSVGFGGGGLGYAGLGGAAVALDTAQGAGEPADNFIGVAIDGTAGGPNYVATGTNIAPLDGATTTVDVIVTDGLLRVYLDGAEAFDTLITLPDTVLIGFTAATGGANNVHEIDNVRISTPPLDDAVLSVSPTTVNLGTIVEGTTTTATVQVANTGGAALTITDVSGPTGEVTIPSPQIAVGTVLPPGATVTEVLEVTPATAGVLSESYSVTANDGSGAQSVTIDATVEPDLVPIPTIASPAPTLNWAVGNTIQLSGSAVDSNGDQIPEEDLTWSIIINHCVVNAGCHTHQVTDIVGQADATFVAPDHEYPSTLEIQLRATDGAGTGVSSVEILPFTQDIAFDTVPSGLQVLVGSTGGGATPFTETLIQGSMVPVVAPSPQTLFDAPWTWASWSSGEPSAHSYTVPAVGETLVATYEADGAALLVSPGVLDFGTVAFGTTASLDLTLSNPGTTDVTLTSVTEPAAPFADPSPPGAGFVVPAGSTVTQTVELSPTTVGAAAGTYTFTPDTGQGAIEIGLTGDVTTSGCPVGTVSGFGDFAASQWSINGDASVDGTDLQLTANESYQAGTAFWTDAFAAESLQACFVASIDAGTGADGLALALIDGGADPTQVGAAGSGLGLDGLGAAVIALDTYGGPGQSGNDVAVAPAVDPLVYSTIVPVSPDFRGRDVQVEVVVEAGQITVLLDHVEVLSDAVTLPSTVLVGFGAATGGSTDRHAITAASLTATPAGGSPTVAASPAAVSFGAVPLGGTATATVTLANAGATDATVVAVSPPSSPFVATNPVVIGEVIPAGGSLTADITYNPTTVTTDTGAYVVEFANGQIIDVPLDGSGSSPVALLEASPSPVALGSVTIGETAEALLTIANTGSSPVTITAVTPPVAPFSLDTGIGAGTVIDAGDSLTRTVTFAPTAAVVAAGELVLATPDQTLVVSLSGTGDNPPPVGTLTASPLAVDVGTVLVGETATATVDITNSGNVPVTVAAVTDPAPPFTVDGAPAPGDTIAPGATVAVTVTYGPTAAGTTTDALVINDGTSDLVIGVEGTAEDPPPPGDLTAEGVDVGTVDIGATATADVVITNTGTADVVLTAVTPPAAPFADPDPPAVGDTIPAGGSITTSITYAPTTAGADSGQYFFETASQTLVVALAGAGAVTPASLSATPAAADFGSIDVDASGTLQLVITNDGATDAVIDAVVGPTAPFTVAGAGLTAGDVIPAGGSAAVSLEFAPTVAGTFTDSYQVDAGPTSVTVPLSGVGTVPDPGGCSASATLPPLDGAGWSTTGAATPITDGVELTPATPFSAGGTIHANPIDGGADVAVCFDASLVDGSGADGLALVFLDADVHDADVLGAAGGGLGFAGLDGVAVTLDTFGGTGQPSSDFVGLAIGELGAGAFGYVATSTVSGGLDGQTRAIEVSIVGGLLTVSVDDTVVMSEPVVLPPRALIGFTAGTGGLDNAHRVTTAVVEATAAGDPPTPLLAADVTTIDFGTVTVDTTSGPTTLTLTNSGPDDLTVSGVTGPAAPFAIVDPIGVGDVIPAGGALTTDIAFAPTATGAAAESLVITAGSESVTISLTGTGRPPPSGVCDGPGSIPGPEGAGWTLNGAAVVDGSGVVLTPDTAFATGSAVYDTAIDPTALTVCFDATIGPGPGGDGMTFALLDASAHDASAIGAAGSNLGFGELTGLAVTLDTYSTSGEPPGDFVGLSTGSNGAGGLTYVAASLSPLPLDGATRSIEITVTGGSQLTVSVDGTVVLDEAVVLPPSALLAFTAGTGGSTNEHRADDVVLVVS